MYRDFFKFWLGVFSLVLLLCGGVSAQQVSAAINASANINAEKKPLFGEWQKVGPNGGDVRSIVIDPSNKTHFYFTTLDGQVYTSYDAGATWRMLYNFDRSLLNLDSMMIDLRDSKTIYVAGHRGRYPGGFFKSSDGGASWRESKDLKNEAIYSITQSSKNPDMILVGARSGVFASFDSGNDWKMISDAKVEPGMTLVESLAIDPRNTDIIYAGTYYRPYKTTDGGKNWRLISKGMIDDSDVFAINIDQRNPDHVFSSACSGIYESWDAGENWKKVQGIPSSARRTRDILLHPSKPNYIYAATTEGFWMSSDGGKSWGVTSTRQLEVNSIAVHPDAPEKVYLGTNNYGVMVSNDFGKSFSQTNGGYSTRLTYLIEPDLEQPNRFYAVTHNTWTGGGFFFVSNDAGASWQASMKNYPAGIRSHTFLQDRTNPNTIYLGTDQGIYRSLDRGASWGKIAAPAKKSAPRRKAVAKKAMPKPLVNVDVKPEPTPTKVAVLTAKVNELIPTPYNKNGLLAATDKGLYRTHNLTSGWERLNTPENLNSQIFTVATSPLAPETIWIGTAGSGVLVSHDSGATWQQDKGVSSQFSIFKIEVNPANPNLVYVGTRQTFFMTKDGGENWERRGGGLPAGEYHNIIVNPNDPEEIFVASSGENLDGLFHSVDGGISWERVDKGKMNLPSRRLWALSFSPLNPNLLLVGSQSGGIYRLERSLKASIN